MNPDHAIPYHQELQAQRTALLAQIAQQRGGVVSRAEAAAFLIDEGIKAQAALFQRIQDKLTEIERLRAELRTTIAPGE